MRFTANAAFSGRAAEIDLGPTTLEASGGGFTVGGGVMYSLSRFLAVDFNLQYMGGEIDEVSVGGVSTKTAVDASSLRAHLGIAWAIGRR